MGIGIGQRRVEVLAKGGIHGGAHLGAVPVGGQRQHAVHVHGIAQRLTHQLVVKGRHGVVQVDRLHQVHGALQHLVAVAEVVDLIHGHVCHQIQGTAVQCSEQRGAILIDLVGHLVQVGGLSIVFHVSLQDNILLHAAGNILEGSGAHGLGGLVCVVSGHDVHAGHIAEEIAVGCAEGHGNLVSVYHHIRDSRKRPHHGRSYRGGGAGFKRVKYIVWGAGLAIMEYHTFTKEESVSQSIIRYAVIGGNCADVVPVRIGLYKALKDVKHDLSSSCGRHLIRVKTIIQVLGNSHGEFIGVGYPGRRRSSVAGGGTLCRCSSACAE